MLEENTLKCWQWLLLVGGIMSEWFIFYTFLGIV